MLNLAIEKKENIPESDIIRYITPRMARFYRTEGGFLSLEIEPGEVYARVNLYRTFPHKEARRYISVLNDKGKEIGLIKSIDDFPPETVRLMEKELSRRYFVPAILKIRSIKEEFEYSYWDVVTDSGERRFTVQGRHNRLVSISETRHLVIDVDGNRFEIADYRKLDPKSIKIIETLI